MLIVVVCTTSFQHKGNEKRKHTNFSIGAQLELIEKLESRVSVARVCDKYSVKKQTVSDIRRSNAKLTASAVKFDDENDVVYPCKHVKVARSKDLEDVVVTARAFSGHEHVWDGYS